VEGSVRKAGNRVRLTAQLIDGSDGSHRWADRFEGNLDDVFELQDRITQEIATALEVELTMGEQARVWRKRSGSPLVYEHFLKGRNLYPPILPADPRPGAQRTRARALDQPFLRAGALFSGLCSDRPDPLRLGADGEL
jgi:hypothetical protein